MEKTQDVPPAQNEIYHVPLEKSEPEIDIKKIEEEEEVKCFVYDEINKQFN